MPVITLNTSKLDKSQKVKLAKGLTDLASEVLNLPPEAFYVFFNEYNLDNIGVSGQLMSDNNENAGD